MVGQWVTGQLADKQLAVSQVTDWSTRGLVNSPMLDLKFGVYNSSKCHFRQITLFICCQYSIWLEYGLGLGLMYK